MKIPVAELQTLIERPEGKGYSGGGGEPYPEQGII